MIVRRLIVPLAVAFVTAHVAGYAGQAFAQGAFPAPLPGRAAPPANDPAFPPVNGRPASDPAFPPVNGSAPVAAIGAAQPSSFPVNGAAPVTGAGLGAGMPAPPTQGGPPQDCMKEFLPLREDAEKKGKLIKTASDRHATPQEACKLIGNFSNAEVKMIKYVESHTAKCGIPAEITQQLKGGHKTTEVMLQKVCAAAQGGGHGSEAGPSLSEVLGSAAALPEATPSKKGGSTFDTLNGNVLTR